MQTLEARLSAACGLPFRVSMDDLQGADTGLEELRMRVRRKLCRSDAVPPRARILMGDLRRLRITLGWRIEGDARLSGCQRG